MTTNPTNYPAEHADYLTEVDARQAAATDGDWGVYDQGTLVEVVAGLEETGHGYRCRRQIARLDEEPIDNIPEHADWDEEQDYAQLLADATFMAKAPSDIRRLLQIVQEQYQRAAAAEAQLRTIAEVLAPASQPRRVPTDPDTPLAQSIAWLADRAETLNARMQLVRDFRVPLKNRLGGYAELTVERGPGPYDSKWAVTDGAFFGKRVWSDGAWRPIVDFRTSSVYRFGLEDALALAEEVAGIEGAAHDAAIRDLENQDTPGPQEDTR
ncbi:hypothetical protein [Streptomyces javensis]|uniref:Uncharacterized protein n=1 Tax=Streptomyces javensis TaxID=114698 RepID=A0ABS0RBI6_9ACTN|nr:hypothetical protein [Streptomyces javensis]MBI0314734.1 hypothetical protein [Streptomyces javensis]